jgi:hypothetical protein
MSSYQLIKCSIDMRSTEAYLDYITLIMKYVGTFLPQSYVSFTSYAPVLSGTYSPELAPHQDHSGFSLGQGVTRSILGRCLLYLDTVEASALKYRLAGTDKEKYILNNLHDEDRNNNQAQTPNMDLACTPF